MSARRHFVDNVAPPKGGIKGGESEGGEKGVTIRNNCSYF